MEASHLQSLKERPLISRHSPRGLRSAAWTGRNLSRSHCAVAQASLMISKEPALEASARPAAASELPLLRPIGVLLLWKPPARSGVVPAD